MYLGLPAVFSGLLLGQLSSGAGPAVLVAGVAVIVAGGAAAVGAVAGGGTWLGS